MADQGRVVDRPMARRTFIKAIGGAGLGFALWGRFPNGEIKALAVIPGGTLDVVALPKFAEKMIIPPAMPATTSGGPIYDIEVVPFLQQILPTGQPLTPVWSYAAAGKAATRNYPAFTIETTRGTPITVTWRNRLVDPATNDYVPHLLPVDPTLHWANPPGGPADRDTRPTFTTTPGRYTGPVPIVTHVHGMERAHEWSDGYPEAWYLPAARNIPNDYATEGTFYDTFKNEASNEQGLTWESGTATFSYPNSQRDSNAWYHDHTLGMTRLNVYAGPAGFYFVRDTSASAQPTLKKQPGVPAVLPGPAPTTDTNPVSGQNLDGSYVYEIPIVIQDRSFNTDGTLFYPDSRTFFDGYAGPYIPGTEISPIWNPEFFGNTIVVNGRTWPYLDVEPRRYRFRFLNGCQSRFLILTFPRNVKGLSFAMIGNEGGFLRTPVGLPQLLLAPAERADVIIDFSGLPLGTTIDLLNIGPDAPFGGLPLRGGVVADPKTTGQVMQFRVARPLPAGLKKDPTTPPGQLQLPALAPIPTDANTLVRRVSLLEKMDMAANAVIEAQLGILDENSTAVAKPWMARVTETPAAGSTEIWEIYNTTVDAHPIHLHEVFFEVINRELFTTDPATGALAPAGVPRPPDPWEDGRKDTVIAYPGEITRITMTFGGPGLFVWHCHIVEHEDNEMMRPYQIT